MKKQRLGLLLGLIFGTLDIIPMFFIENADNPRAILSAFIHRLITGWIISAVKFPLVSWGKGIFISLVLTLPVVLIVPEDATTPILATSVIGGAIIGWAVDKWGR